MKEFSHLETTLNTDVNHLQNLASKTVQNKTFYLSKKPMFILIILVSLLAYFTLGHMYDGIVVRENIYTQVISLKKLIAFLIVLAFVVIIVVTNLFMLYLSTKPLLKLTATGFQFMNNKKEINWLDIQDINFIFEKRSIFYFAKWRFDLTPNTKVENRFNYSRSKYDASNNTFYQFLREIKGAKHEEVASTITEYWHIARAKALLAQQA